MSELLANRKDESQAAEEAQTAANQSRVGLDAIQYFATAQSTTELPQIRLPTFSEDYQQWSEFRDLFTALFKNDESLSGSQKMSYLRTQLKDDALLLLANMTLTDDSSPIAWKLLKTHYSNPRRVLATYLEGLLSHELISDHSAPELNAMLLASSKALDAIRFMKIKVDNWDPILIHVTLRRLSVKLREEWETTLGLSNDIPKYEQLHDFLKSRVRAWENFEISPTGTLLPENKKSANKCFAKALGHRSSSIIAK